MSELRRLFEAEMSDEDIQAYVGRLAEWCCERCGKPIATRQAPPVGDRVCFECSRPVPRPAGREELLRRCGVPARYAREPWQQLARQPHPYGRPEWRLDQWAGDPWCLIMHGGSDAGKTMLSVEVLWRLLPRFPGAAWRTAAAIQESMSLFLDSPIRAEMAAACSAPLLVVDDYGKAAGRAGSRDGVDGVLATRHAEMLATILTTNLTPAQLLSLDGGIGRRIVSDGVAVPLTGDWRRAVKGATTV